MQTLLRFVALIVGAGIGFAASEAFFKTVPSPQESTVRQEPRADTDDAAGSNRRTTSPRNSASLRPTNPSRSSSHSARTTAASRVRTGSFQGLIRTEVDEPLASVEVRVEAVDPFASQTRPPVSAAAQAQYLDRRAHTRTTLQATTDSNGNFEIGGLDPELDYRITASLRGYQIPGGQFSPGRFVELVALRATMVPVRVELPNGDLANQARIQILTPGQQDRRRWFRSSPMVDFPPGPHIAFATTSEYRSPTEFFELALEDDAKEIVFRLAPRPGIQGSVTVGDNSEREFDSVTIMTRRIEETDSVETLRSEGEHHFLGGGKFSVPDLQPGNYQVGVTRFPDEFEFVRVVTVRERMESVDFALPPVSPDQVLEVEVLDPNGNATPSYQLQLTTRIDGRPQRLRAFQKALDLSGSQLYVGRAFWDNLESGRTRAFVSVRSEAWGSKEVEVLGSPVRIQYGDPATLTVRYPEYAGSGLEESLETRLRFATGRVRGVTRAARDSLRAPEERDDAGSIQFGPVDPGEYEVVTLIDGSVVSEDAVKLPPGHSSLSVSLPVLFELTLLIPPASVARSLSVWPRDTARLDPRMVEIPENSSDVQVPRLPSGTYDLMVEQVGEVKIMTVRVTQDTTVTFEPSDLNAIRVVITSREGSLAQSGFQDGDLIVGQVGGDDFDGIVQIQAELEAMQTNPECRVRVLRGTTELEIRFDATVFRDPESSRQAGGKLAPGTRP